MADSGGQYICVIRRRVVVCDSRSCKRCAYVLCAMCCVLCAGGGGFVVFHAGAEE